MTTTNTKISGKKIAVKKKVIKKVTAKKVAKTTQVKIPKATNSVENKNNVPIKMWKSFKEKGQKMYNNVMDQSDIAISLIAHPKMPLMNPEHWNTIRHNFACFAAWGSKEI